MTNDRYRNYYQENCSHFCTASTVGFLAMLADDRIRRMILRVWDNQRVRYGVLIEGLILRETNPPLCCGNGGFHEANYTH